MTVKSHVIFYCNNTIFIFVMDLNDSLVYFELLNLNTGTSSTLYNYVDHNTLAHADDNIDKVVEHLEKDSLALIEWFSYNQMKANPDKFQAIAIGKKSMDKNIVFELAGNNIKCKEEVKLLGHSICYN